MDEVVERDAKLFEAGVYEDKGVEVTEEDLDRIVSAHEPVPIKVEHTDSPLVLGTLVKVWRAGKELFGRLAFTKPAWELVKASGAKKLSVGLKKDKSALVEVSLVRNPRVADAAVFAISDFGFWISEFCTTEDTEDTEGESRTRGHGDAATRREDDEKGDGELQTRGHGDAGTRREDNKKGDADMELDEKLAEKDRRIEELEEQIRAKDVEVKLDELKKAGKLAPASEKFARSILMAPDSQVVKFDDGEKPVSELFLEFLEAQPKVVEFGELAKGSGDDDPGLCPEARTFYEKLGLTPETVSKYRTR